jgi:pimeloyl-ACP methyl ester carboxylesterase
MFDMRLSTLGLSWTLFLCALTLSAAEPAADDSTDHQRLMVYRDSAGREQPVKTPADWQQRRQAILIGMQQAMGKLPEPAQWPPLDVRVSESIEQEGTLRQTISLVTEGQDRLTAFLWIPRGMKSGERRPAMLALHPTGALGKRIVAGEGKSNRAYGLELAQRGYVVIAPDYPSFGDLKDYDFEHDAYISGTMKGIVNHRRCVDLLESRSEVDPARIGVIGHSLGGHNAMFVGVFEPRLKAIVSSCGWCPFHEYYGGKIAGWTSPRYMPLLRDKYGLDPDRVPFDFCEVVAALAPRAFFSNSPLGDQNFDVGGVKKAIPVAQQVYDLLGASDMLQVRYPDCGHDFPDATRREAYEFLDRVLQWKPERQIP